MIPAPIQPASTPHAQRFPQSAAAHVRIAFVSLLNAKLTPAHGLTYPSARACAGAHTHATAAVSTRALIARRIVTTPLTAPYCATRSALQAICPAHDLRRIDLT